MNDIRAFAMPKWGIEMAEGLIGEWRVAEGQAVRPGETIVSIETDKITNDVDAEFEGVLRRRMARQGETYPVGALLAVFAPMDTPDAEIDAFVARFRPAEGGARTVDVPVAAPASPPAGAIAVPAGLAISPAARRLAEAEGIGLDGVNGSGRRGRITFQDVDQARRPAVAVGRAEPVSVAMTTVALDGAYASPLAKRLAVRHGVALHGMRGTGPRGRIRKDDVLARLREKPPRPSPAPVAEPAAARAATDAAEIIALTPMRKAIARRLTLAKTTIPHFYLRATADVGALLRLRRVLAEEGTRVTLNDMIVRACAVVLRRSPAVNIQVHGEDIHRFVHADIAVAVATERGLLTPIVRAAETKTVAAIGTEIRALAEAAHAGGLRPEQFEGGTFTVSNLGMFGIDGFDAVINPPQAAILAVGGVREEMAPSDDGFRRVKRIALSLSCDHRAIDGAVGARFLAALRDALERPTSLLGE